MSPFARTFILFVLAALGGESVALAQANYSIYNLDVQVLPSEGRLHVKGDWTLPPLAEAQGTIEFLLSPKMRELEISLMDSGSGERIIRTESRDEGGDTRWTVHLSRPIAPGKQPVLYFEYSSDGTPAPQFKVDPSGSFAGAGGELWYPQRAFSERETGTLRFRVLPGTTVIAPGRRASSDTQERTGEFVFNVQTPSKFGFANGQYHVVRRNGRVPVTIYLLRPSEQGDLILHGAEQATVTLTGMFGKFPYPELALVEVDFPGQVAGTSEFGFILASSKEFAKPFDLGFWAHEIGHQWWGVQLRAQTNEPGAMLLTEGMAQFGALVAVEEIEGPIAAGRFRKHGRLKFGKADPSAAGYFRLTAAGMDLPLASRPSDQRETLLLHRLANSKGFLVWDMLASEVGNQRFALLVTQFLRRHANQRASLQELLDFVETGSKRDLGWFSEQWLRQTGAPEFTLSGWTQRGGVLEGTIEQLPPNYRARLELLVEGSGGCLRHSIQVFGTRTTFRVVVPFPVANVTLDPHNRVLRWDQDLRAEAAALIGFTQAEWERRFGDRTKAIRMFEEERKKQPVPDRFGGQFYLAYGLAQAYADEGRLAEATVHLQRAIAGPVRPAHLLPSAYLRLALIAKETGDHDLALLAARSAVVADEAAGAGTGVSREARTLLGPKKPE